jgi:hypothetical protein
VSLLLSVIVCHSVTLLLKNSRLICRAVLFWLTFPRFAPEKSLQLRYVSTAEFVATAEVCGCGEERLLVRWDAYCPSEDRLLLSLIAFCLRWDCFQLS